jgi:hypothetical protein
VKKLRTRTTEGEFGGEDGSRTHLHGFAGRCITALLPRQRREYDLPMRRAMYHINNRTVMSEETGAGEEARTLDLNLGKVALYQLSYSRLGYCYRT